MRQYVVRRIFFGLLTFWMVTVIIFGLVRLKGDPASFMAPDNVSGETIAQIKQKWGLDRPFIVQYGVFIKNLLRGDMGMSFRLQNKSALSLFWERLPATIILAGSGLLLSVVFGVGLGAVGALKPESIIDRVAKIAAILGQSMPVFWVGVMLMMLFAVQFRWLPVAGGLAEGGIEYLVLPALTISFFFTAAHLRITRSSMLDVMGSDYIKMLRAKGLPEREIVWKHALRNASTPILALLSTNFARLVTGTVITETIFAWPGIGRLLVNALWVRDYAVVQAVVLFGAAAIIVTFLLVDLGYAYLDPRIRLR